MLSAGSVVAGYRIERVLGGGMGAVYLAANPTLPRFDALKALFPELSRDADFRARFTREADVAAALRWADTWSKSSHAKSTQHTN